MKQRLLNHINSITDPALRATCETIPLYPKFDTWPASLSFHHAYEGGLLAHTVEVCDLAEHIWRAHEISLVVLPDILIAAALFHDLLKMEEYDLIDCGRVAPNQRHLRHTDDPFAAWITTNYQKTIGHICGSAAQFQATAINCGVSRTTIDAVVHCILAHHGRKEWGSPVEPQTLEALILHQADMLSAKFGATKDSAPQ